MSMKTGWLATLSLAGNVVQAKMNGKLRHDLDATIAERDQLVREVDALRRTVVERETELASLRAQIANLEKRLSVRD